MLRERCVFRILKWRNTLLSTAQAAKLDKLKLRGFLLGLDKMGPKSRLSFSLTPSKHNGHARQFHAQLLISLGPIWT